MILRFKRYRANTHTRLKPHVACCTLLLALAMGSMPRALAQQRVVTENLPDFDLRRFHFGFLLGGNTADLFVKQQPNAFATDSLLALDHLRAPGFNLGIVSSLNLNGNWSVRFLPSLSFQERALEYAFRKPDGSTATFTKPVESTWLEFPVHAKFRSDRINNFAVYLIGGGKYSLDMASQQSTEDSPEDQVVLKLKRADYSVEMGGGFDFFLTYFKFGIELRSTIGLPNVMVNDGTRFSNVIESLRTRAFSVSLTFEG
jgi:Outer membrane protein beta-barrel domain